MSRVESVEMRAILDSRGRPTVEAVVRLRGGASGTAGAPSGASTGAHEVRAFPDGGVPAALAIARSTVAPALRGLDSADLAGFDQALHAVDGTSDFSRIGGNTATALSLAAHLAHAAEVGRPLWQVLQRPGVDGTRFPAIVGNCLNGGRHAIGGPDIQEFHAFAPSADPAEAIEAALEVHRRVGEALHARFPKQALGLGDEGGWVAPVGNVEALEILAGACAAASDALGRPIHPGLDLAASEFFRDGRYRYREQTLDTEGQVRFVAELVDRYGLRYVEDPLDQEAFEAFAELTRAVGEKAMVVGDDLYTTALARLERGIALHATNAVLIKVNQVGTVTDTLATVDRARAAGLATVTSHRSGDLPEGWLAHVALGTGAAGLKCGLLGGERVAKLNELLRLGARHRESHR